MNEQKKILFYEEGFFEKSINEYDPILSSYLDEEKKKKLADYVIINDHSISKLNEELKKFCLYRKLLS